MLKNSAALYTKNIMQLWSKPAFKLHCCFWNSVLQNYMSIVININGVTEHFAFCKWKAIVFSVFNSWKQIYDFCVLLKIPWIIRSRLVSSNKKEYAWWWVIYIRRVTHESQINTEMTLFQEKGKYSFNVGPWQFSLLCRLKPAWKAW